MNTSNLSDEESLRLALRQKEATIEEKRQEVYQLQLSLKAKAALELDLSSDVRALQADLEEAMQSKEEELARQKTSLVKECREREAYLESQLEAKVSECCHLAGQLEALQSAPRDDRSHELASLRAEVTDLRQELADLSQTHAAQAQQLQEVASEAEKLRAQLQESRELYSHSRERCEELRNELNDLKKELEVAQEDSQAARLELLTLKASLVTDKAAEDGARGNSLFSEVEDNRQAAINCLKQARADAASAKQEATRARIEVQEFRLKNALLHKKWEEFEDSKLTYLDEELMNKHKEVIEQLKNRIIELENEVVREAAHLLPGVMSHHKWLETMMKDHKKKENELNSQIARMRLQTLFNEESKVRALKAEERVTAENMCLLGQIKQLELRLQKTETSDDVEAKENSPAAANVAPEAPNPLLTLLASRKQKKQNKTFLSNFPSTDASDQTSKYGKTKSQLVTTRPTIFIP